MIWMLKYVGMRVHLYLARVTNFFEYVLVSLQLSNYQKEMEAMKDMSKKDYLVALRR